MLYKKNYKKGIFMTEIESIKLEIENSKKSL